MNAQSRNAYHARQPGGGIDYVTIESDRYGGTTIVRYNAGRECDPRAECPRCETRKYGRQRQIVGKRESFGVTKGKRSERIDKRGEGRRKCARLSQEINGRGDTAKGVSRAR